jgi:hypothetical protein
MNKRFTEENIIRVLIQVEAVLSEKGLCQRTLFPMRCSTPSEKIR